MGNLRGCLGAIMSIEMGIHGVTFRVCLYLLESDRYVVVVVIEERKPHVAVFLDSLEQS